jgi:hypothetical protein
MNPGASPGPKFRRKLRGIYTEGLKILFLIRSIAAQSKRFQIAFLLLPLPV